MTAFNLHLKKQRGSFLLEGLLAVAIFSVGILSLVALQAASVKYSGEAKYRVQAAFLANNVIAQMWAEADKSQLAALYNSPDGAKFITWRDNVVRNTLPGVANNLPTIIVSTPGNQVTVTVQMNYTVLTGAIIPGLSGTLQLTRTASMRWEG